MSIDENSVPCIVLITVNSQGFSLVERAHGVEAGILIPSPALIKVRIGREDYESNY